MDRINADWLDLRDHAADNAAYFLTRAKNQIDGDLGDGYAKNHPELLSGQIQAMATQHQALVLGKCVQTVADALDALGDIAQKLDEIETAISNID